MSLFVLSHIRSPRIIFIGVILCYLLTGVALGSILPLGEAPDEPAHFQYARYVAHNGALPVMRPQYEDNETVEAFQPPMYYVLAGGLMTLVALVLLKKPSVRGFLAAAVVIALATLSKPSALTLMPGLVLALVLAWRALPSQRERWIALGLLLVISLAGSGWWFLRNQQLYGDPIGTTVAKQALAANDNPQPPSTSFHVFVHLLDERGQLVAQYTDSTGASYPNRALPLATIRVD